MTAALVPWTARAAELRTLVARWVATLPAVKQTFCDVSAMQDAASATYTNDAPALSQCIRCCLAEHSTTPEQLDIMDAATRIVRGF